MFRKGKVDSWGLFSQSSGNHDLILQDTHQSLRLLLRPFYSSKKSNAFQPVILAGLSCLQNDLVNAELLTACCRMINNLLCRGILHTEFC